jgi:hypothetical protein
MAIKPSIRNYHIIDAELCMFTSNLCDNLTRDLADLTPFGMTAPKIAALKALGDAFEVFPTDDVYIGYIMIETEAKNAIMEQVVETIRNMALRVEMKWGVKSGQYKTLGVVRLNQFSEDVLLITARNVHTRMTAYLADLAAFGLTQQMLDDFEDLNESFEVARNHQKDKIESRDIETQNRIEKGNELYDYVVQYCEIGKRVYAATDPAKYNDYIIYKTTEHGLSKPKNLLAVYVPGPPMTIDLSWDVVTDATSYDVYYNIAEIGSPSGEFNLLNNFPTNSATTTPIINKRNYFKVKAKNDEQTSNYSDEVFLDVI